MEYDIINIFQNNIEARQLFSSVALIIITAIITHLFDYKKMKSQQKIAYEDEIGKRVVEAYVSTRDILMQIKKQEALPKSLNFTILVHETSDSLTWYPQYATDKSTLLEYCNQVSAAREKYEPYLSARATAYLFVLERYFLELALFLKSHQCFYRMNYIAALTWGDVQKMQRDFDDYIIKEINSPRHYLESKNSSKYKLLTRIYKKKYITKSVLMQFSADEKMCDLLASEETENYEIVKRAYELVLKKQLPVESN